MVDVRTTAERIRDRKEASRRAIQNANDEKNNQEIAVRETNALAKKAETETVRLQAENERAKLEIAKTVAQERYHYEKNRRQQLDRLVDDAQRHKQDMELAQIKQDSIKIEAEAKIIESKNNLDELNELKDIMDQI